MGKFCFIIMLTFSISACREGTDNNSEKYPGTAANGVDSTTSYPFVATYSSSFEMGDEKNAKVVLDTWKAWQEDELENSRTSYADSVTIQFEDGTTFKGNRDSLIEFARIARSKYASVKDTLIALMPLKSKDRNHEWVLVYGVEYTIDKKGKADTIQFHQVWRMKDHKADYMARFKAIHR